jgi:hypothetical protein
MAEIIVELNISGEYCNGCQFVGRDKNDRWICTCFKYCLENLGNVRLPVCLRAEREVMRLRGVKMEESSDKSSPEDKNVHDYKIETCMVTVSKLCNEVSLLRKYVKELRESHVHYQDVKQNGRTGTPVFIEN